MPDPSSLRRIARTSAAVLRAHGTAIALVFTALGLPADLVVARMGAGADPWSPASQMVGLFALVLTLPGELGVAGLVARLARGEAPGGVGAILAYGLARVGRLFPALLVYTNRVSVGLVLLVVPGLAWIVGGRYLTQMVALRPDDEPFAGSMARVRGDWARQGALTAGRLGSVAAGGAFAELADAGAIVGLTAFLTALPLTLWSVVDAVAFLERERVLGTPGTPDGAGSPTLPPPPGGPRPIPEEHPA